MRKRTKLTWSVTATGLAITLVTAACGGNSGQGGQGGDENGKITVAWWGSKPRNDYTVKMLKQYDSNHSDASINTDFTGWDGYWDKMSTKFTSGSGPDILQMDKKYLREYASKQSLKSLDHTKIDLDDLDKNTLKTGQIDGKQYAIPTGVNAATFIYDPKILKRAGIDFNPNSQLTWKKYADIAAKVTKNVPGVYGTQNLARWMPGLKYWTRDHGESLFNKDATKLTVSKNTVSDWFQYWRTLQDKGYTPSADKETSYGVGDIEDFPIVKKKAAFVGVWSNQYTALQKLTKRPLDMSVLPHQKNDHKPYWQKPSMYWSISKKTNNPTTSEKLVNYMMNSPKASKHIGNERGVPINHKIRKKVKSRADKKDTKIVNFVNRVDKIKGDPPPVDPKGMSEIIDKFQKTAEQVMFKKLTPDQAADEFIKNTKSILNRG